MKPKYNRRHFVKQASALALVSFTMPSKNTKDFLMHNTGLLQAPDNILSAIPFKDIWIQGELLARALRNFDRLEDNIYEPKNDFNAGGASEGWPGDKEGRIILGLTLQAQATHREPKYLKEIIDLIPQYLNEKGYLGPIMNNKILEQQLSGHGWFLRGLCEYYNWKGDIRVKKYIIDIIQNLALPTIGHHRNYPIEPESREKGVGSAVGNTLSTDGVWMLSSDIGCDFIFLDGLVQVYSLFPSKELKKLIEEMIERFLQMDLVKINAQTHATLTALRGLMRYYLLMGKSDLLIEVENRYILYRTVAITENFENYNWFSRPEWTEPCAIIDSFMLSVQLWQCTGNSLYLEDAHHIYYNAICHTQRTNGGFGLDNCTGITNDSLKVYADEAYWCCTMRGGEGIASAIQYNYFTDESTLTVPFYNKSECVLFFKNKKILIRQTTNYPFENEILLNIVEAENIPEIKLKLFAPSWFKNLCVIVNGKAQAFKIENGFILLELKLEKGTRVALSFDQQTKTNYAVNKEYSEAAHFSISYGPLLLGYEGIENIDFNGMPLLTRKSIKEWEAGNKRIPLSTLYHLMEPKVSKESGYQKQLLFKMKNATEG